jgi:hypothetical protein
VLQLDELPSVSFVLVTGPEPYEALTRVLGSPGGVVPHPDFQGMQRSTADPCKSEHLYKSRRITVCAVPHISPIGVSDPVVDNLWLQVATFVAEVRCGS